MFVCIATTADTCNHRDPIVPLVFFISQRVGLEINCATKQTHYAVDTSLGLATERSRLAITAVVVIATANAVSWQFAA